MQENNCKGIMGQTPCYREYNSTYLKDVGHWLDIGELPFRASTNAGSPWLALTVVAPK